MTRIRNLAFAALVGAVALAVPVGAQDADTPLDKALQQVEGLIATLKSQPGADAKTLARLEEIAGNLRKEKESRGGRAGGGGGGGGPTTPWGGGVDPGTLSRWEEGFFRGTDLKDEEKAVARTILVEFISDYGVAKNHEDEKSKAVIREHTEKRIAKSFASKDANKLKDNLDFGIKFWEGRFGRGGR
jgi:hypothetical protein